MLEGSLERGQARIQVAVKMNAQRPPPALQQNVEIPARLRGVDHAESGAMPWDRQVLAIVCGNLKKDTAVGAALARIRGTSQPGAGRASSAAIAADMT